MTAVSRGFLHAGQYQDTSVTLAYGQVYPVRVQPDDPSVDFDLHVYDENLRLIAVDESADASADALLAPAWSGVFYLRVIAARGSSGYTLYL